MARWPGATELQEADLLGTIRAFFLEDMTAGGAFVSEAAPESGAKVLGTVLKSAGVPAEVILKPGTVTMIPAEVMDQYTDDFGREDASPAARVPEEGYEWLGGREDGGPKDG